MLFWTLVQISELLIFWLLCGKIKRQNMDINALGQKAEKVNHNYLLATEWIRMIQSEKRIEDYLWNKGYHSVIIYGLSDIGVRLYEELKNARIQLVCLIDQNAFGKIGKTDIINPGDDIPDSDVIIVATSFFLLDIETVLLDKVSCPIIALDDLINDINIG